MKEPGPGPVHDRPSPDRPARIGAIRDPIYPELGRDGGRKIFAVSARLYRPGPGLPRLIRIRTNVPDRARSDRADNRPIVAGHPSDPDLVSQGPGVPLEEGETSPEGEPELPVPEERDV
jgi:hypothetical protein